MARLLRGVIEKYNGNSELWRNYGGLVLFIGLMVMSISIISMLVFGCADGFERQNKDRRRRRWDDVPARRRASVYSATGGANDGVGVHGGDAGGGSNCGGGGCGGGVC
ncbi:unnamed protein product [Amaranthus hypochondriacus]